MAYTLTTVALRNQQAAQRLIDAINQGKTVTYTFTAASSIDLGSGVLGTLACTVAATLDPPEFRPIGTDPGITPPTVSN